MGGGVVIQITTTVLGKNKYGREMEWFNTPNSTKDTNLALSFVEERRWVIGNESMASCL